MDSRQENQFKALTGKTLQEAVSCLQDSGYKLQIQCTYGKKCSEEAEERVIRIKESNEGLEVLVGLFQLPSYRNI